MKFIEFRIILFIASWTMLHGHIRRDRKNKLQNKHTVITDNDENHVGYDVENDRSNNHGISVSSQKSLKYSININPVEILSNTFDYGVDASKKAGGLFSTAIQTGKGAIVSAAKTLGSIDSKKSKITVDYKSEENVMKSHKLHGSVGTNHGVEISTGLKGLNIQLNKNGHHQYETNHNHEPSVTAIDAYQTCLLNAAKLGLSKQLLDGGSTGMDVEVNPELHQNEESAVNYNQEATGFSGHEFQARGSESTGHFGYISPAQLTFELNENTHHQHETNHNHKSSVKVSDAFQTGLLNAAKSGLSKQLLNGGFTGMNVEVNPELHQHEESAVNYNQEATGFSGHGFQARGSESTGHFGYISPEQLTFELNENTHHQHETNHNHKSSVTVSDAYQTGLLNAAKLGLSKQLLDGGFTGMNFEVNPELHQNEESAVNYNQEATGFSGHEFQAHGSESTGHFGYSSPEQLTFELNENAHHQYETNHNHKSSVTVSDAYQTDLLNAAKLGLSKQLLDGGSTGMDVGVNPELHQHEESAVNYNQEATGFSGHEFQAHGSKSTGQFGYNSPEQLTFELNENAHHQHETNHNHKSSATVSDAYQTGLLNAAKLGLSKQLLDGGSTGMDVGVNPELHQHEESAVNYNQEATGFSGHEFQAHGSESTGHFGYSSPEQLTFELNENTHHQHETNHNHKSSVTVSDAYQTGLLNAAKLGLSKQLLDGGSTSVNINVSKSIANKHHLRDKVKLKNNLNSNSEGILHKRFKPVSRVAGKLRDIVKSAVSTGKTRAQTTTQLSTNGITIKGEISLIHKADHHASSSHH